jgi:uncharacterized protein YacL (UPF0231 family)
MRIRNIDHARTLLRQHQIKRREYELQGDEASVLVEAAHVATAQRYIDTHDTLEEFLNFEDEDGQPLHRGRGGRKNTRSRSHRH